MMAAYRPCRLAKRDLRPIVLACATIVLAIVLGLTVSALTLQLYHKGRFPLPDKCGLAGKAEKETDL